MMIAPINQYAMVVLMKINLKLQNTILLLSFLATIVVCTILDFYDMSVHPPAEPNMIFGLSDLHPWKGVFLFAGTAAALALLYVAFRYNKIRHQKVDNYLASLVFFSAIYQGAAYVINVVHMLFQGLKGISEVGLKTFMPLGILALMFFTFVAMEVFIKPAMGHQREHGIEVLILILEAFGIVMGVIVTLLTYTEDGSPFEITIAAVGFSVLGMIGIIVGVVTSKIFKIRRSIAEQTQARALETIAVQLILLLAVTFLMIFVEMASFTKMTEEMAFFLRIVYSLLSIAIAWLYLPAFIAPASKKEKKKTVTA